MSKNITDLKGFDAELSTQGLVITPIEIRNVTDPGEHWPTLEFEMKKGRAFHKAHVSKQYKIDSVEVFRTGCSNHIVQSYGARLWTMKAAEEGRAMLKTSIQQAVDQDINHLQQMKASLSLPFFKVKN